MHLKRIIYVSQAVNPFTPDALRTMVQRARANNTLLGVCGLLLHSEAKFLQVLEGTGQVVDDLYQKICSDPRHDNIRTLVDETIQRRLFRDWGMEVAGDETISYGDRRTRERVFSRLLLTRGRDRDAEVEAIDLLQEMRRVVFRSRFDAMPDSSRVSDSVECAA